MRKRALALLMCSAGVACATDPSTTPGGDDIQLTRGATPWRTPIAAHGGHVPGASGGGPSGMMFFDSGDFTFTGDIVPGTASFDAALVIDETTDPSTGTLGGGAFDVTVGGASYTSSTVESLAAVFGDGAGSDYLVLGAMVLETDPGTGVDVARVLYVVVPAADFAPGATVALDGTERVALFAAGPADAEEPEVMGAAITGTLTFTSGGLVTGDTITATLAADFGAVDWSSTPPGGGAIVAGAYTLTVDPASVGVYCDGALLAGHESDFAGLLAADVGFADGAVTVGTPSADAVTVDGTVLASGYGVTSLTLTAAPDTPDGIFAGYAVRTGTGPLATNLVEADLALDGTSADATQIFGWADVVYESVDGSSICAVGFQVTFTAP